MLRSPRVPGPEGLTDPAADAAFSKCEAEAMIAMRTSSGCRWRRNWVFATFLLGFALAAGQPMSALADANPQSEGERYRKPGPHEVSAALYDWVDRERGREVPVKIYYPKTGDGPFAVIIFSHGLGSSRDGYEYLGRHWASHGYVSVHVQHKGSDSSVWQGNARPLQGMRRAAADPRNAVNRPRDITFVIDQMEAMNRQDTPLKRRLDLERVGIGGHSFGAYTALAIAGQVFVLPGGREVSLSDPRVKAAIPMSAPVSRKRGQFETAFGQISIPCLHMTGTKDESIIGDTSAEERRIPFDHINGADQYLVIFTGGDHMIFSGRGRVNRGGEKDPLFQDLIRTSSVAFWDAYLKKDARAKAWLAEGGFQALLGQDGTLEKNLKASAP